MKLSCLNVNETLGMDKERGHMIERIIHLTLDILYLLTGEDYIVLKMSYGRVTHSSSPCISGGFGRTQPPTAKLPPPPLTPERNNDSKILEVTQKIIELLTGEETRFTSKAVKQEIDDVLRSEEESGCRNTPERCPRPPERCPHPQERCPPERCPRPQERCPPERCPRSPERCPRPQNGSSRDTTTACMKKKTTAAERTSKVRRRGRPRKRRIRETAPSPQPPLGPEDIHVITEDFQSEGEEAMATGDDQQNNEREEVTKDLHTGRSQDKLPPLSVMEVGEDKDDREENSKHVCRRKRWHRPKGAALSGTTEDEEEESGESPGKDSDWVIPADSSLLNISSDGPGLSPDNGSEDTIVKVSLDEVQEEAELTEAAHRSVCRNGKKKTFTCLDCGRCFASSEQLESHGKVHTGEAPFSCTACGSSFASSEELGEHLRVHTSEKLFACSQCGKCFTIKANLIAHRRVHTGDKPFTCAECGRRFALRSSLETHLPVHAVEKPYPCVLCGKCFTTSGRLAVHQTTHTGDKTYECEDCGKIFTTSSSMNRHRRTHTGEKPYSCMVCGKCFNRETNLYRHQMIHTR